MPNQPTSSVKNVTGYSDTFQTFMRRLMKVPHSEIKAKLDAEKAEKQKRSKRASRASGDSSKRAN